MNEALALELERIREREWSEDAGGTLSRILQAEGLSSPDRFADILVELVERERLRSSPERSPDPLLIDKNQNPGLRHIHRAPDVPFSFRGTLMEPGDITRLNGKPLHFAIVGEEAETQLVAYERYRDVVELARHRSVLATVRGEMAAQSAAVVGGPVSSLGVTYTGPSTASGTIVIPPPCGGLYCCPSGAPRPTGEAQFFSGKDFGGDWAWLGAGGVWRDLTQVPLSQSIFSTADWNDQISSVRSGDGALGLFEHTESDGYGSSLTVFGARPVPVYADAGPICGRVVSRWSTAGRQNISNLGALGFDDRISAIYHWS